LLCHPCLLLLFPLASPVCICGGGSWISPKTSSSPRRSTSSRRLGYRFLAPSLSTWQICIRCSGSRSSIQRVVPSTLLFLCCLLMPLLSFAAQSRLILCCVLGAEQVDAAAGAEAMGCCGLRCEAGADDARCFYFKSALKSLVLRGNMCIHLKNLY